MCDAPKKQMLCWDLEDKAQKQDVRSGSSLQEDRIPGSGSRPFPNHCAGAHFKKSK